MENERRHGRSKNRNFKKNLENLLHYFYKFINDFLGSLIEKNHEEEVFYSKLWDFIKSDDGFFKINEFYKLDINDLHIKAFALLVTSWERRLPYYHLKEKALEILDDEYEKCQENIKQEILKINFILESRFSVNIDKAFHLLNILESRVDKKERTILIENLFEIYEIKIEQLEEQIKKLKGGQYDSIL